MSALGFAGMMFEQPRNRKIPPDWSAAIKPMNVAKFEEKLRLDQVLQAKVEKLFAAWDGDKDDEQAVFDAAVAAFSYCSHQQ